MPTLSFLLLAFALLSHVFLAQPSTLPRVDLGYEVHEALEYNKTSGLYKFANIRFAQPPVGKLRFAAPVTPEGHSRHIENGNVTRLCPQATPSWQFIAQQFSAAFTSGNASGFNLTESEQELQAYLASTPPTESVPGITEDCLFLDVVVPQAVFDSANNRDLRQASADTDQGAPVLVWIHGGGYTQGSKNTNDPTGLVRNSQSADGQGIIYVAINYRLGAFGWMGGPSLQAAGAVPNAGLHDQRLAIEWVSRYIHLFGGNGQKITIMGESAGGGSVLHQITAHGGQKPVPFQRAILQSPAFEPRPSPEAQENITQAFLFLANVTSLEEAQRLDSATLMRANLDQVGDAPYGSNVFGPTIDGSFVPMLPGLLLNAGLHAKNIEIMAGHQANEGPSVTPPDVRSTQRLREFLAQRLPSIRPTVLEYIVEILYPENYSGAYPYSNGLERTLLLVAESIFTCNTNYINRAYSNMTYAYEFRIPPAFHAQDVPYTFYNGQGDNYEQGLIGRLAQTQQTYITNFAITGDPNGPQMPVFPTQGQNMSMNAWNATNVGPETDPTTNYRCLWWQKALYY